MHVMLHKIVAKGIRQPRCWNCSQSGHIAKESPAIEQESIGSTRQKSSLELGCNTIGSSYQKLVSQIFIA